MDHIPVHQVPMLRCLLLHPATAGSARPTATTRRRGAIVPLGHPQVNNPPLVTGMNQLVLAAPLPVGGRLVRPLPVHPADEAGQRHPEEQRHKDDRPDNVVLEKLEDGRQAYVLEDVDDADNMVGIGLLALAQVAEALEAGRPVGQDVHRGHGVAGAVKIPAAAALAGVRKVVAHAGLLALRLAEGNTLPVPTLALLNTVGLVRHVVGLGTVGGHPRAGRLLLTGGVVGRPTLGMHRHVLAVVAARRVLVGADAPLLQLAVLVAAGVAVLRAQQAGIALLVALHPQVSAEGLLRLRETPRGLGQQHLANEAQRAGRELFIVHIIAGDAVGVHEVGTALAGRGAALRYVGVMLGAPVVAELVGRHQVRLARNHPLAVVIATRAQSRVEVERVAVLEVFWRADAAHAVTPRRAHVGQPQNAALKLDVREQVGQAEVLVGVLAAEDLQQVAHIPAGAKHVVVHLVLARLRGLAMNDDLLDDEAHAGKAARLEGVPPHGVVVDLVDAVNQADEIVDGGLGVGAAHLLVEPAVTKNTT